MSDYGMFFDSKNGDRKYNAKHFRDWICKLYTTGVFVNCFKTTLEGGMDIAVSGGYVNVNGAFKTMPDTTFTLAPADATNPRIDSVVIESTEAERDITMRVVTGTPAAEPVALVPSRTDSVYQLVAAQITVPAGATEITASDVKDTRMDDNLCGYLVRTVDSSFEDIVHDFNEFVTDFKTNEMDRFKTYTDMIKDGAAGDIVADLEAQIVAIDLLISGTADNLDDANDDIADSTSDIDDIFASLGESRVKYYDSMDAFVDEITDSGDKSVKQAISDAGVIAIIARGRFRTPSGTSGISSSQTFIKDVFVPFENGWYDNDLVEYSGTSMYIDPGSIMYLYGLDISIPAIGYDSTGYPELSANKPLAFTDIEAFGQYRRSLLGDRPYPIPIKNGGDDRNGPCAILSTNSYITYQQSHNWGLDQEIQYDTQTIDGDTCKHLLGSRVTPGGGSGICIKDGAYGGNQYLQYYDYASRDPFNCIGENLPVIVLYK